MADASTTPPTPWRRRIGTAPKSWVIAMAVGVCLAWLPFAGRSLSPDEAGYLIVGGQWAEGSSLYGDFWVDRPPVLIAIFEAADALGGAVPLRLIGTLAAILTVILSGVLGRIAAPERRSAPLLTAGTAAVCVATPLFGATVVNGELLGLPFVVAGILAYVAAAASRHQVRGFLLSLAAGAAGAIAALVKQSMVDVFVVAAVLLFTSGAARRKLPGLLAGALGTVAIVIAGAWARGTVPADLWDAVVTFRLDAARVLASTNGHAPRRLVGLVGALAASGVPLVVAAFAWKGRGAPSVQGPWTAPDLRVAAYTLLHVRAARRVPGWQLLGALPDGAGARSRAVRGGVRSAACAGHEEHRRRPDAGRLLHRRRAGLDGGDSDRPTRGAGDRLPQGPRGPRRQRRGRARRSQRDP